MSFWSSAFSPLVSLHVAITRPPRICRRSEARSARRPGSTVALLFLPPRLNPHYKKRRPAVSLLFLARAVGKKSGLGAVMPPPPQDLLAGLIYLAALFAIIT